MMNIYSQVEYLSSGEGSSCGYCKATSSNYSQGMWAHVLSVEDYQNLIDRGWRRSGMYCYKPTMSKTCCPLYTIKCDATNLKLSRSQKKILKKMTKFLKDGLIEKHEISTAEDDTHGEVEVGSINETTVLERVKDKFKLGEMKMTSVDESVPAKDGIGETTNNFVPDVLVAKEESPNEDDIRMRSASSSPKKDRLKTPRPGDGIDPSKPQCKKAKILRLERKQKKLKNEGLMELYNTNKQAKEKILEDFIKESVEGICVNTLELKLVKSSPPSTEFEATFEESHSLYMKYQIAVHKDPPSKCTKNGYLRFLIRSPLQIRLSPANCDAETMKASWRVFVKYQMGIHKETEVECCYRTFRDFLVSTPLQPYTDKNGPPSGYGSFHHQYWLNGKLIAVGVIDILPKCVSSVYFFYDPDYSFLSLGTYGSLRELELVRSYAEISPDLKNYYMGFYIHSCPKMMYKARLVPSYLLCPEIYTWHKMEYCLPKLDASKYSRLDEDENAICEDSKISLNQVLILWKHTIMTYEIYRSRSGKKDQNEIAEYAELVGRHASQNMLLLRR